METTIMENQMEKKIENEMEYIGARANSPKGPRTQIIGF